MQRSWCCKARPRSFAHHHPVILGDLKVKVTPSFRHTFLNVAKALPSGYGVFHFVRRHRIAELQERVRLGDAALIPEEAVDDCHIRD